MKGLLFTLLVAMAFVACSKGDETPKAIELTGGTTTSQTFYADETQKSNGIKFNATALWTATVNEVAVNKTRGSNVEWLTLSAYEGPAGEQSITLSLHPNYSGSDRRAEVKITCSGTIITITVEQKATTQSGENIKKDVITKIAYNPQGEKEHTSLFEYDSQRCITVIKSSGGGNDSYSYQSRYTYNSTFIREDEYDASNNNYLMRSTTYALENGRIVSYEKTYESYRVVWTYNSANQIIKMTESAVGQPDYVWDYEWSGGNMVTEKHAYSGGGGTTTRFNRYEYGAVINPNTTVDLCDMMIYIMPIYGMTSGGRCKNMPSKLTVSGDSTGKDNGVYTYTYELDTKGRVVKIFSEVRYDDEYHSPKHLDYQIFYKE